MYEELYQGVNKNTILRIQWLEQPNTFDLTNINKGLISVHARWSGYSWANGNFILKLLNKATAEGFNIYLIDIEKIDSDKQKELFGDISHGYFETVWIENGKIEYQYRDNNKNTELAKFKDFLQKKINFQ